MSLQKRTDYFAAADYEEALRALDGVYGMVLFEFAREVRSDRDVIVRNSVARAATMAKAIFRLWEIEDYQDCWILHRCLLERLFHLAHLRETDGFELFEAWSFLQQYEALNRVKSDPEFSRGLAGVEFSVTPEQKKRACVLSGNRPNWRRPKAEDVARRLDMRFLYRYGYDYASRHVHPMADDGVQDFYRITKLKPAPDFPDERVLLSNTILICTVLLQEALNASTLAWRRLLFDFIDELRSSLATGVKAYRVSFVKLAGMFEGQVPLGGNASSGEGAV